MRAATGEATGGSVDKATFFQSREHGFKSHSMEGCVFCFLHAKMSQEFSRGSAGVGKLDCPPRTHAPSAAGDRRSPERGGRASKVNGVIT